MAMTERATAAPVGARAQKGPPLWVLAIAYAVLTLAAVALSAGAPLPTASGEALLAYQRGHVGTMQLAAFLQFSAATPLAIWAATAYRRLRGLGITAPGSAIAFAGGLLAAGSLALVGLVTWTRVQVPDADPALARALTNLAFAAGAAGFTVPFALLMAGVAVPSLILRFVPRPLAWSGLVIAAIGVLSSLTLVTPALDITLPISRYLGLLWLVIVSFLLPRTRPRRRRPGSEPGELS